MVRVFRSVLAELKMRKEEWCDLLPLAQSIINNSPSPKREKVFPITAFTSTPINTFIRKSTASPVYMEGLYNERRTEIEKLRTMVLGIRESVHNALQKNRERSRKNLSTGKLPRFTEGDYVLVARTEFPSGEKISLRWRGPRRILRPISDYVYLVEDLRNGELSEVHISRLKFYRDADLDSESVMSHVRQSETGMPVRRLMNGRSTGRIESNCAQERLVELGRLTGADRSSLRRRSNNAGTSH